LELAGVPVEFDPLPLPPIGVRPKGLREHGQVRLVADDAFLQLAEVRNNFRFRLLALANNFARRIAYGYGQRLDNIDGLQVVAA
jgi:hypothetical protein